MDTNPTPIFVVTYYLKLCCDSRIVRFGFIQEEKNALDRLCEHHKTYIILLR